VTKEKHSQQRLFLSYSILYTRTYTKKHVHLVWANGTNILFRLARLALSCFQYNMLRYRCNNSPVAFRPGGPWKGKLQLSITLGITEKYGLTETMKRNHHFFWNESLYKRNWLQIPNPTKHDFWNNKKENVHIAVMYFEQGILTWKTPRGHFLLALLFWWSAHSDLASLTNSPWPGKFPYSASI